MKSETQNGWMLVDIVEKVERDTFTVVRGELQDGASFDLKVRTHLVEPIENTNEGIKRGWLSVEYQGQRERQASIVLPAPAQEYGHKVTIDIGRFKLAT